MSSQSGGQQVQQVLQVGGGQQVLQVAAAQQQQQPTMVSVSLQDLATTSQVNGTVSQQGGIVTFSQLVNQSIPVQLSIPGHSQPITFSVSLPESSQHPHSQQIQHQSNGAATIIGGGHHQQQPIILTSQQQQGQHMTVGGKQQTATAVTVNSVGKLVNGPGGAGAGTVVLQGPTGNIIHLPQQQLQAAQYASIKPAAGQNLNLVRTSGAGGQLVVRQPAGSLLLQMQQANTGGAASSGGPQQQTVQIRSLPVSSMALQGGGRATLVTTPSPQGGPLTPQTPGVPPSPVGSVTSPPGILTPEPPTMVQLANHAAANPGDHHFLLANQKQQTQPIAASQILSQQALSSQAAHLKMRQQRKQSLK